MFVAKLNGDLEETLDEAIDEHGVVKDGKRVTVNLLTMDGDDDKLKASEAKCEAAYQKYCERTCNAWRTEPVTMQERPPILLHVENYVGRGNKVEKIERGAK